MKFAVLMGALAVLIALAVVAMFPAPEQPGVTWINSRSP